MPDDGSSGLGPIAPHRLGIDTQNLAAKLEYTAIEDHRPLRMTSELDSGNMRQADDVERLLEDLRDFVECRIHYHLLI